MTPEIVKRDESIVVGIRTVLPVDGSAGVDLWAGQLVPRLGELAPVDSCFYSIFGPLPGDKDGRFEHVAGVMTDSFENIPTGMVGWIVPAGTYAMAEADGLEAVRRVCRDLLTGWLPGSTYKQASGPLFASVDRSGPDIASARWRVNVPVETPEMAAQLATWFS